MQVTIEVRERWLSEAGEAMGEYGSNDMEHDLLYEIAETISEASGQPLEIPTL